MEITIKQKLSKEILENIFITALEGGSNYWYYLTREQVKKVREAVPDRSLSLSEAIFKAVYEHGVSIEINDAEDEDEILGTISLETIQERIQARINDDSITWAINNEIQENGDASSSDVIFQVITLGEVTFG